MTCSLETCYQIDILTGHEEIGNLHFDLKIIFNCIYFEKLHIFLYCIVNYERITYSLKKFCKNTYF